MQLQFFQIPVGGSPEQEKEINLFLGSHASCECREMEEPKTAQTHDDMPMPRIPKWPGRENAKMQKIANFMLAETPVICNFKILPYNNEHTKKSSRDRRRQYRYQ